MRPFVDQYPEDYNESLYYAYVAARIDSLNEAIRVFERTNSLRPDLSSVLIHLSDVYMAAGDFEKAIDALNRYEVIEGKDPQLTIKKISFYLSRRDTVGALRETTALVDYNPKEPAYHILKGNMFEMTGERDSTLACFLKAEELNPDYGAAKLALADFYRQEGDSLLYDNKTYEALLSEDFDLEQKIDLLGEYLHKLLSDQQNTERGDHLFSVLRNQYPHEPAVLDLAARYSAAKGNYDEACEEIAYAIDLSPTEEKFRGQLMTYQMADGKPEKAIATFREAEKQIIPPRSLRILHASAAQMAKKYDEAIEEYQSIIFDIAPNFPTTDTLTVRNVPANISYDDLQRLSQIYTSIGDCLYGVNRLPEAYLAYENALLLFPDNSLALNNYAYFLSENNGDLEKAAEMSERSLEGGNSSNPTYLDTYAWILYRMGNYSDARKFQSSAVEISENDGSVSSELYDHYGDILEADGDHEAALNAWKMALDLDPDNSEIITKIKNKDAKK